MGKSLRIPIVGKSYLVNLDEGLASISRQSTIPGPSGKEWALRSRQNDLGEERRRASAAYEAGNRRCGSMMRCAPRTAAIGPVKYDQTGTRLAPAMTQSEEAHEMNGRSGRREPAAPFAAVPEIQTRVVAPGYGAYSP